MKKFLVCCSYFILTAAVSSAGFLMPSAMSSYQDQQIAVKIEHPAIEPMELTYSSSLIDTLRLLSQEHYYVEYPASGSSRSADEIYEIALDTVKQLKAYHISIPSSGISNHTVTLQLAIASVSHYSEIWGTDHTATDAAAGAANLLKNTGNTDKTKNKEASGISTAVVWSCSLSFEFGYYMNIWIDDKSGKAVAFMLFTEQTELAAYGKLDREEFISQVTAFAQDYYGLPAKSVQQENIQKDLSPFYANEYAISSISYIIQLKEESGKKIKMPLILQPELMMLN